MLGQLDNQLQWEELITQYFGPTRHKLIDAAGALMGAFFVAYALSNMKKHEIRGVDILALVLGLYALRIHLLRFLFAPKTLGETHPEWAHLDIGRNRYSLS